MPGEPEVHGLVALMLLNDARRDARFADDAIVLLPDQDRSLWNLELVEEGRGALERALALGGRGPYVLQAAMRSCTPRSRRTWRSWRASTASCPRHRIAGGGAQPSGRHRRNRRGRGRAGSGGAPRAGTEPLPLLHATHAELLRRLDRDGDARAAYKPALGLVNSDAERRFLEQRLAELQSGESS